MASIYPLQKLPNGKAAPGTLYRCQFRRKGLASQSFTGTLEECKAWEAFMENERAQGRSLPLHKLRATTVEDVIDLYTPVVEREWKSWRNATGRLRYFKTLPWAKMDLTQDIQGALMEYRDGRLTGKNGFEKVLPQTLGREFTLLACMFKWAMNDGPRIPLAVNPVRNVKVPSPVGGVRNTKWRDSDVTAFLRHLGFESYATAPAPSAKRSDAMEWALPWLLLFLRHFGNLRMGAICGITRDRIDLDRGCIVYYAGELKNSQAFECPMDDKAEEVVREYLAFLKRIGRENDERIFPSNARSMGSRLHVKKNEFAASDKAFAHLDGLTFHDLRHTWTTELLRRRPDLPQIVLLKVTGRESMVSLNRYYNPEVNDLRAAMRAR